VTLYDTTLRDGAQSEGISLSVTDKLRITERLDRFGLHYVEGGWPANPKDLEYFRKVRQLPLKRATVVAFGSTRRAHTRVSQDFVVRGLLAAKTRAVTVFGKSWDLHVHEVLRTSLDENLRMIHETVAHLKTKRLEVIYDAEHFFDAYRANPEYAMKTLRAAQSAGVDTIVLCDTNGGSLPEQVSSTVRAVAAQIKIPLGIHTHNDMELAVANAMAAVEAGCTQVQGTINGYGERCGNANLCSIIPILKVKLGLPVITDERLRELSALSRFVAEVCNMKPLDNQPFVGESAFAHKGGVHINAVMKTPRSYEHMEAERVGNRRRLLVSELGGKTAIVVKARHLRLDLGKDTPTTKKLWKLVQSLEHQGYHFEAAEGSFELLMRRALKKARRFFDLEGFRVIVERTADDRLLSEATIKLRVNGVTEHTAAEGNGPVHALDRALRKALQEFYPTLAQMHLADFKVRVIDEQAGTAAKVRVLIQSRDAKDAWWTVGVSENVIEASWQALVDSVEYKLTKDAGSSG